MSLLVVIGFMAVIAAAAYWHEQRNASSRASRSNRPCNEPDDAYGDGRSEEFHGEESWDSDGGGDGDGD
ncbi:hypothetical protein [Prosthecobacter sp.]|uniref:hypothetical protein n=1 Tax=Prosthecobacter sp. TaxID=1965333 RepID=UPI003784849A